MNIISCKNKEEASKKAAEAIGEYFKENNDNEILFLSCGGSGIRMLNDIKSESLSSKLTVTMLDSRLQVEPQDENFYQLTRTDFYIRALQKRVRFLDVSLLRNLPLKEAGERFEAMLKNWLETHKGGKVIASIGMGPDGHIAGIIPFPEDQKTFDGLFKNETRLSLAYEVPSKNQFPNRLTTTYSFFSKIDRVVSYITGEDKRDRLLELAGKKAFPEYRFPGIILSKLNEVSIFTDQIL